MSSLEKNIKFLRNFNSKNYYENSSKVKKGSVFFSFAEDPEVSFSHAKEAKKNGASLIVSSKKINDLGVINLVDEDIKTNKRKYLNYLFNFDTKNIIVNGVTGTNGKSSTIFFLHQLLKKTGHKSTFLSTIKQLKEDYECEISDLTTPDTFSIYSFMERAHKNNKRFILLEVSSHAIDQERTLGIDFSNKCLTSFSPEHLDYHKTEKAYMKTKEKFISEEDYSGKVVSIDNKLGRKLLNSNKNLITISTKDKRAEIFIKQDKEFFNLFTPWGTKKIQLPFFSDFMISNFLCSLGLYGLSTNSLEIDTELMTNLQTLPGRVEKIKAFETKNCYVDYAHTPEALEKVLEEIRKEHSGEIICLFGCGGERDKKKRAKMGTIAKKNSDFQIITNDNSRRENPIEIVDQILKTFNNKDNYEVILDREKAILFGLQKLKTYTKDSVLLIAGKGHEEEQLINGKNLTFNDVKKVKENLDAF